MKDISRKDFLKLAATGTATVAALSMFPGAVANAEDAPVAAAAESAEVAVPSVPIPAGVNLNPIPANRFGSSVVPTENKPILLENGIQIRWLNTAGYEIILPNSGKHLLVDPWLDESNTSPFPLDAIEQCDYIVLSHIHGDHADSVRRIEDKFGRFPIIVPGEAVETLTRWQDVDLCSIYKAYPNMTLKWDDMTIEVFQGRHTESNGHYSTDGDALKEGGKAASGWMGQAWLNSYLVTCSDGTRILLWAGMTTEEQKNLFRGLHPDIAIMHLSPKHDLKLYAQMVDAMGPKVVIPHHYDMIPAAFLSWPEAQILKNTTEEYSRQFVDPVIGFDSAGFADLLNKYIAEYSANTQVLLIDHHKWYKFAFGYYTEG